eukprot:5187162-Karenia_brevis.AAC.1
MLKVCRKVGALCLCGGIVLAARWIPSEYNPADMPSRVFDPQCHVQARDRCSTTFLSNGEVFDNSANDTQECQQEMSFKRDGCFEDSFKSGDEEGHSEEPTEQSDAGFELSGQQRHDTDHFEPLYLHSDSNGE